MRRAPTLSARRDLSARGRRGPAPLGLEKVARDVAESGADLENPGSERPGEPRNQPAVVWLELRHALEGDVADVVGVLGFAHAVLGSVAEKVVRRAKCPVLTVRARG